VTRFSVKYIEFRKLRAQQAKPEAAKAEPVQDPWDKQIEELTNRVQAEWGAK
jgi:hypothetical protein